MHVQKNIYKTYTYILVFQHLYNTIFNMKLIPKYYQNNVVGNRHIATDQTIGIYRLMQLITQKISNLSYE